MSDTLTVVASNVAEGDAVMPLERMLRLGRVVLFFARWVVLAKVSCFIVSIYWFDAAMLALGAVFSALPQVFVGLKG